MTASDVTLSLTRTEALVLFEWLVRVGASTELRFEDHAEQKVLWAVEAELEKALVEPFSPDYKRLVSEARQKVRDGKSTG